jgi:hypothetical protein
MPDIHFETAKNSELIFTSGGRHLCSTIHPTKEARQWIAHHESLWKNCRTIIVLGLGCGYHVRALKMINTPARVFVLEPSQEIMQAALKIHPFDLGQSEIAIWKNRKDLEDNYHLRNITKKSYAVLTHEPSAFANPEFYADAKQFLLGRDTAGLRWLFENREMAAPEISEPQEISIKTLDPLWQKQLAGEEPLQPVMHALRELIL